MTTDSIPAALRDFILKHIQSIAEMEALAMMVNDRDSPWSAERAAARLYIPRPEAAAVLERLRAAGLAEKSRAGYRFACASASRAAQAEALVALYAVQLIPVTHLIHSRRASRIQQFADAFQIRRDE